MPPAEPINDAALERLATILDGIGGDEAILLRGAYYNIAHAVAQEAVEAAGAEDADSLGIALASDGADADAFQRNFEARMKLTMAGAIRKRLRLDPAEYEAALQRLWADQDLE